MDDDDLEISFLSQADIYLVSRPSMVYGVSLTADRALMRLGLLMKHQMMLLMGGPNNRNVLIV